MHYITTFAVALPVFVSLLCTHVWVTDGVTSSLLAAGASSISGTIMWLRSRYIATLYLSEREARKQHFTASLRRRAGVGTATVVRAPGSGSDESRVTWAEPRQISPESPPPRTVARLSPVLPAFTACCFFLLSVLFTISATLQGIRHARTLGVEM
ncbi:hypothetical protein JKF63_07168 [Porcisia hertigi]|uniref:Uncharacterized protein n=1 Tax=Porcisia hertigi TaxID=2761500 RepID=A0A836LKG5_9TRYP|nr:hypothetical protein JKF63_07168 [Porcisia hertigi]